MVYEKQTWVKYDDSKSEEENIKAGSVGTDSRLNHMEKGIADTDVAITNHAGNKVNPHAVTKSQVGLSLVDNAKQATKVEFDAHSTNKTNPHTVTAAQVGAYTQAQTDAQLNKYLHSIDNRDENQPPVWYMTNWARRTCYEFKLATSINKPPFSMNGFVLLESKVIWNGSSGGYPVQIAYAANGNGSAVRYATSDTTWGVWRASETVEGAQAKATVVQTNLNAHTNSKTNPHSVTAAQVGAYTKDETVGMLTGVGGIANDISNTNLNLTRTTGFYRGANLINAPNGNAGWWYITYIKHSETFVKQIAYSLNHTTNAEFQRVNNNGVWSAWEQIQTVSDTGWVALTITAGFAWHTQAYARKINNQVWLKGALSATSTINTTFCTLPVQFRPKEVKHTEITPASGVPANNARLYIETNGNMALVASSATSNFLWFDEVSYLID